MYSPFCFGETTSDRPQWLSKQCMESFPWSMEVNSEGSHLRSGFSQGYASIAASVHYVPKVAARYLCLIGHTSSLNIAPFVPGQKSPGVRQHDCLNLFNNFKMTCQDGNDSLDFYRNIAAFTLITALDAGFVPLTLLLSRSAMVCSGLAASCTQSTCTRPPCDLKHLGMSKQKAYHNGLIGCV